MMKPALLVGFASLAHGLHIPAAIPAQQHHSATRHSAAVRMAAGDEPDVRFGEGSGWKPTPEAGSKHTMSGGFESTDTPDFFDDSEYSQKAGNIDVMDGVYGSTGLDKLKKMQGQGRSTDPGVAGALEVNPDIYQLEVEDLSAEKRGIQYELKPSGMVDQV